MGLAVFALERVLVVHMGTLSGLDMSLLGVLVVLEPSSNSVLVLCVKEVADLLDVTNHCKTNIDVSLPWNESPSKVF